ncbi:MAG: hypothetical protein LBR30_07440, partial [Clostridioides sp.]|nr:hypothetical protein [Clostridioides sp.]
MNNNQKKILYKIILSSCIVIMSIFVVEYNIDSDFQYKVRMNTIKYIGFAKDERSIENSSGINMDDVYDLEVDNTNLETNTNIQSKDKTNLETNTNIQSKDKSNTQNENKSEITENEIAKLKEEYTELLEKMFDKRNKAILSRNEDDIKSIFNIEKKFGQWAFEHETKKMQYLENWEEKQGIKFDEIIGSVKIRRIKEKENKEYNIICSVSTK